MPADIQTLESLELFNDLSKDELKEISGFMEPVKVSEGEMLARRKDTAHTFFITLSGNYMISFKEGRAFTIHDKGDVIGMSTVIAPFQFQSTTIALTEGEVLSMPGSKLLELIQGNSYLGDKIMHRLHDIAARRAWYIKGFPEQEESKDQVES